MRKDTYQERRWAVHRFLNGESPEAICLSLGHSRSWLYKWVERSLQGNPSWYESQSRRPLNNALHTSEEIEEIVKLVRLNLYNEGLFCGDQAILWELGEMVVSPLPSLRTINRILDRHGLTHRSYRLVGRSQRLIFPARLVHLRKESSGVKRFTPKSPIIINALYIRHFS